MENHLSRLGYRGRYPACIHVFTPMLNSFENPYRSPTAQQGVAVAQGHLKLALLTIPAAFWGLAWVYKLFLFENLTLGDHQIFRSRLWDLMETSTGILLVFSFLSFEIIGPFAAKKWILKGTSEQLSKPKLIAAKALTLIGLSNLAWAVLVYVYFKFLLI